MVHQASLLRPGDLVLDPFIGSGTTAVAAIRLGRHYLGAELNREYYGLAEKAISAERDAADEPTTERTDSHLSRSLSGVELLSIGAGNGTGTLELFPDRRWGMEGTSVMRCIIDGCENEGVNNLRSAA